MTSQAHRSQQAADYGPWSLRTATTCGRPRFRGRSDLPVPGVRGRHEPPGRGLAVSFHHSSGGGGARVDRPIARNARTGDRRSNRETAPTRAPQRKGRRERRSYYPRSRPGARSEGRAVGWKGMEASDYRPTPAEAGERPSERGMSDTPRARPLASDRRDRTPVARFVELLSAERLAKREPISLRARRANLSPVSFHPLIPFRLPERARKRYGQRERIGGVQRAKTSGAGLGRREAQPAANSKSLSG